MNTASKGGRETVSLFGGDPRMSHFTVSVRYLFPEEAYSERTPNMAAYNAPKRRREQQAQLKALGFKRPYFQFRNGDEAAKTAAKAKAEAFAKEWSTKAGFELEVAEGCFL